jgi:hypothetical protein
MGLPFLQGTKKGQYIRGKHGPLENPTELIFHLPRFAPPIYIHIYYSERNTSLHTRVFPRMDFGGYKMHKQLDISVLPI